MNKNEGPILTTREFIAAKAREIAATTPPAASERREAERRVIAAIKEAEGWASGLYWDDSYESDVRGYEIPAEKWRAVRDALAALDAAPGEVAE